MPTVKVKPFDPASKPCEKYFRGVKSMMAEALQIPIAPHRPGSIRYYAAGMARHLEKSSAKSIAIQVGKIIVEARRIAVVAVALLCVNLASTAQPRLLTSVTGSFLTCGKTQQNDFVITWPETSVDGIGFLYLKSGPTGEDVLAWDWPETTGIIMAWDSKNHTVIIADPDTYLTRHALWYTVTVVGGSK